MKKGLIIGLTMVLVLGLATIGMATNLFVDGTDLGTLSVTADADPGHLRVDVYEYTSPDLGSHHWFEAQGGWNATVSAGPGGSGLVATSMHGTSKSAAAFLASGAQNFDVTSYGNDWGMIEYYVSGSDSAELKTTIGGAKFHRTIGGSYYTLLTATGDYNAQVGSFLIDSTVVPFDDPFTPGTSDVIAGGYVNFYNFDDPDGSVTWDETHHPTKTGISSDIHGISIPDARDWETVGSGWLRQEAWGAGGISNWNGQSISGPDACAYQEIYHGSDWNYFAGISAQD